MTPEQRTRLLSSLQDCQAAGAAPIQISIGHVQDGVVDNRSVLITRCPPVAIGTVLKFVRDENAENAGVLCASIASGGMIVA